MKIFIITLLLSQNLLAATLYSQGCRNLGDDYVTFSIEIENKDLIKNSGFAVKITAFEDVNCKTPYLNYNQYFSIDKIQNEAINLRTDKITYTALTEEVASALRSINYCEFHNWKVSIETDVTGKSCDGFSQLSLGAFYYQIIKIESGLLKFGAFDENLDGRSVQNRPVQFDELDYTLK